MKTFPSNLKKKKTSENTLKQHKNKRMNLKTFFGQVLE